MVFGETAIARTRERIRRLTLYPEARPLPEVLRAIVNADGIVVGPGSLYSSILPNLLVESVASTISGVRAVRIYVANLMTEPGETDSFSLDDHLRVIREHARFDLFDYILVNNRPLDPGVLAVYAAQGSRPVTFSQPLRWGGRARIVECSLAGEYRAGKIRHAAGPVAQVVSELVARGRP